MTLGWLVSVLVRLRLRWLQTHQSHDNKHGESAFRKDLGLQADVLRVVVRRYIFKVSTETGFFWYETHKHDKFHEALTTHQASNGEGLPPFEFVEFRGDRTTDDLASEGNGNNSNCIAPCNPIVEQAQIGAQSRQSKVQRQKHHSDEILNLFGQLDGKASFVRADQAGQKGAEDGVNTNDTCKTGVSAYGSRTASKYTRIGITNQ